ncbi:MAG: glutamate decarboxylase [Pseudomonadota bacterium]
MKKVQASNDIIGVTYSSRYMDMAIPKYAMPEEGLPEKVAYQLIHDELQLDGKASQNLASFVSTWMEPEAERLMQESIRLNLADEDEYPHVVEIEKRCVNILARLYHADSNLQSTGAATVGSSEAIMLAGLAMKWRWRKKRQQLGLPSDKPNIVMGINVQVVWDKFARYFDVEPRFVTLEENQYSLSAERARPLIDENTIGVVAILGSTLSGEYENVMAISDMLDDVARETGLDIPIHVDAASGGFVAPFVQTDLIWDFRVKRVVSINVSGHKYGLVYPGIGWVLWRSQDFLQKDLIFHVNYLGGEMPTFCLNFSRPSSYIIGQYYNFIRLGISGYTKIMCSLKDRANYLQHEIEKIAFFETISKLNALPVVVWKMKPDSPFSVFELTEKLRQYGWIIPAYTLPKNIEHIAVCRIVVREHFSRDLIDNLLDDMKTSIDYLTQKNGKPSVSIKHSHWKVC